MTLLEASSRLPPGKREVALGHFKIRGEEVKCRRVDDCDRSGTPIDASGSPALDGTAQMVFGETQVTVRFVGDRAACGDGTRTLTCFNYLDSFVDQSCDKPYSLRSDSGGSCSGLSAPSGEVTEIQFFDATLAPNCVGASGLANDAVGDGLHPFVQRRFQLIARF